MDPLSISASAAGILSLAIQVSQALIEYYNAQRSRNTDTSRTLKRLENLLDLLCRLSDAIKHRHFSQDERDTVRTIESSIESCAELITELDEECRKIVKPKSGSAGAKIKFAGRVLMYPLRQSTLTRLDEDVSHITDDISLALSILHLQSNNQNQNTLEDIRQLLNVVRSAQISQKIREWLQAPDPTIEHSGACSKSHPNTGQWFVTRTSFQIWLSTGKSCLWINGFAGTGKSVLCSTAIRYAFQYNRTNPHAAVAFFYFTFTDPNKQTVLNMFRTLILQLATQLSDGQGEVFLETARLAHAGSQLSAQDLQSLFHRLVQQFQHAYIFIDALDECPEQGDRSILLEHLRNMQSLSHTGLHVLVTSRDLQDIRDAISGSFEEAQMTQDAVDADIAKFVTDRLEEDLRFAKWRKYHDKIRSALTSRANGVFRWVECQFEEIANCPRKETLLEKKLDSLPRSLDKTYERMLRSIDRDLWPDARKMLTILCIAQRPLSVDEIIDCLAISEQGLDPNERYEDETDILRICPGLVMIDSPQAIKPWSSGPTAYDDTHKRTLSIAHFSVQEYLESDRIPEEDLAIFRVKYQQAHGEMAKLCLKYLTDSSLNVSLSKENALLGHPLLDYAAKFWMMHRSASLDYEQTLPLLMQLFDYRHQYLRLFLLHYSRRIILQWVEPNSPLTHVARPLYFASFFGVADVVEKLLLQVKTNEAGSGSTKFMLNGEELEVLSIKAGMWGTPLQVAAHEGHEDVVRLLLNLGVNANTRSHDLDLGSPICCACSRGHDKTVKLLLDYGADPYIPTRLGENALHRAAHSGFPRTLQILIESKMDINLPDQMRGHTALHKACQYTPKTTPKAGYLEAVQLLLDGGAAINAQKKGGETPLHCAVASRAQHIVALLLDRGADPNIPSNIGITATHLSATINSPEIIQLLAKKGANINATSHSGSTPLHEAVTRQNVAATEALVQAGADVNIRDNEGYTVLHLASMQKASVPSRLRIPKEDRIVEWSTEVHQATVYDQLYTVRLLVDHGADPNAKTSNGETALLLACEHPRDDVIEFLLKLGVDVNAQDGENHTAIENCVRRSDWKNARLLVEYGADIRTKITNVDDGVEQTVLEYVLEYDREHGLPENDKTTIPLMLERSKAADHTKPDAT